ncbi:MFS transporter [Dehalobacter sp. DCM]|uniref:MFS transporter n=1 Tax=Dehalobacter sp. DCM TaxID=2907827 RepID=UPI0030818DD6|nr:MFS transporter [Dehalobacter sp. DCM]
MIWSKRFLNMTDKKTNITLVMLVYLAGVFIGALDTGIVTPARTIIQNNLFVEEKLGIWLITLYTLAYAASIPLMGKLADLFGRKVVYLTSIFIFGLGSLFCGLAQGLGSFTVLLLARVIQAIGGGGIIPLATAEFGTSIPLEKRGLALGLVGGVYGIANILGASAGSAILSSFGPDNWPLIFYINLPITALILIIGVICLPNTKPAGAKNIDILGISILTLMILALLYGLKNIDFLHFTTSAQRFSVYPFLTVFILLLPLFIWTEKKAADPILNISYFSNRKIAITFTLAFITGFLMMGMIFVPQFSENALKMAPGTGGYFVIILGLFAGIGAPVSGKLIDHYGPRVILACGFVLSIAGSLFLVFATANHPSLWRVILCLVLMGLGTGFTMGTPLNYMMLENTTKNDANSALAALSLVRTIGTTIAPAIMVAFLAQAGLNVQANVRDLLPREITLPPLPYATELTTTIDRLRSDPSTKRYVATVYMPDLSFLQTIDMDMSSDSPIAIPADVLDRLKASDVTTITANCKRVARSLFFQTTPELVDRIEHGMQIGIEELNISIAEINQSPTTELTISVRNTLQDTIDKMIVLRQAIPGAFNAAGDNYLSLIDQNKGRIEQEYQRLMMIGFKRLYLSVSIASLLGLIFLAFYRN